MDSDLPAALLAREKDNGEPAVKRSKLVLPAPQVSDQELENLVKMGHAGESAIRMALEDSRSDATATQTLLSDYGRGAESTFATPLHLIAKTPLVESDSIIQVSSRYHVFFTFRLFKVFDFAVFEAVGIRYLPFGFIRSAPFKSVRSVVSY